MRTSSHRSDTPPAQAVVVGGGYIGAEVGAALAMNGLPTSLVFPEARIMERIMTAQCAGFYEKFYQGGARHGTACHMVLLLLRLHCCCPWRGRRSIQMRAWPPAALPLIDARAQAGQAQWCGSRAS